MYVLLRCVAAGGRAIRSVKRHDTHGACPAAIMTRTRPRLASHFLEPVFGAAVRRFEVVGGVAVFVELFRHEKGAPFSVPKSGYVAVTSQKRHSEIFTGVRIMPIDVVGVGAIIVHPFSLCRDSKDSDAVACLFTIAKHCDRLERSHAENFFRVL